MGMTLAILAACLCTPGGSPSAEKGFALIQSIARSNDAADLQSILPADAFDPWRGEEAEALQTALAKQLANAKVVQIRDEKGQAVVRYRLPDDKTEFELPLRLAGETWQVAAARGFPVNGDDLRRRKGRKFAKATLTMRTENDSFDLSALSFVRATNDPELCGNRMDIWYCHNGDLHSGRGNRVADLGKTNLKKIKGLPVVPHWEEPVTLREKHSYLVHCQSHGLSDFFVVLHVKKRKHQTVEVEWTLLTGGLAAPESIASAQPALDDPDDPEALPGLCGKHG